MGKEMVGLSKLGSVILGENRLKLTDKLVR